MSRIIVKGLPTYLSDARLREHFSQHGAVTDVKLMKRPDGTSRRFGFVGFRSEEEAKSAMDYFNKTFIDTSRIHIEIAKKIGDEGLNDRRGQKRAAAEAVVEEPASKRKATTPAEKSAAVPKDKVKSKAKDVSFEEFMAVMAPKSKRKAWQNEETGPNLSASDMAQVADQRPETDAKERKKEKKEKRETKAKERGTGPSDTPSSAMTDHDGDGDEEQKDEAVNDDGLTDLEYMRRRMRRRVGAEEEEREKAFEQSEDEQDASSSSSEDEDDEDDVEALKALEKAKAQQEAQAKKEQETVDAIMETGRLFIRNLPFSATEEEIESFFSSFGHVSQVHIPLDKSTKAPKGWAFVTFADPAHALAAFRAKDGSTFQGRLLHLIPAVDKNPKPEAEKTLKQKKQEQRKADAGKDFNWSMLYMNSDAVASSVADRLGVSKADILNPEGADNAAVRLALAETRVIQETKEFLEKEGINVDAFNRKDRSDTTLLVKNIPYGTSVEEMTELFSKHGEVGRVLIPPSGTIAIVDLPIAGEARAAFRALAYKRFKNSILYLEKAPANVFRPGGESGESKDATATSAAAVTVKPAPVSKTAILGIGIGSEADAEMGATLFIKNLSFSTTDSRLGEVFGSLSDFAFARIQTKNDPKNVGGKLSMGYGFVGFKSVEAAKNALKAMQGHVLDGHSLSVSFARRGQDEEEVAAGGGKKKAAAASTKIIVKNLPFEATKREVRELFGSHGQLKSVRVPKKMMDSKARGFAFVEFVSRREAESAMEALKHTHLLGRHLVLEWSGDDLVDVDKARLKAGLGFGGGKEGGLPHKRTKLRLGEQDIAEAVALARAEAEEGDE
ncbi:RNA-binding domain-containing protein [Violaceomyces palustris]|uniref:RNA-binding domain-containing protein n=1 Tax=Violaceomyces palustris TaxID=1673888 RepID=A0ACD0P371_9BASI|nr:RNA-binding domain-containing protein [Violaceomyces palustris]